MFEQSEFEKISVLYGPQWGLEASFLVLFVGTKSTKPISLLLEKVQKKIFETLLFT